MRPLDRIGDRRDRGGHSPRVGIELAQLARGEDPGGDEQNALAAFVHRDNLPAFALSSPSASGTLFGVDAKDALTKAPTFFDFLRRFVPNVGARMSGGFSVPLTAAAIFWPNAPLRLLFACLAAIAVVTACYFVWRDSVTEAQAKIAVRDAEIKRLMDLIAKPQRTTAEQTRYDNAKKLLQGFGGRAVIAVKALRHLRTHGSLSFGMYDPPLPVGMKRDDVLWVYNACLPDGLVTRNITVRGEQTYEIPAAMQNVLDDLLYDDCWGLGKG